MAASSASAGTIGQRYWSRCRAVTATGRGAAVDVGHAHATIPFSMETEPYLASTRARNRSAARRASGTGVGEVQEADAGGEGGVGAQVGVVSVEPVVQKGLAHRREHPLVGGAHAGGGVVVGARPLPHRPFQRPMSRADQRGHHLREPFPRWKAGKLAEMAPVVVAQLAHASHERGAVAAMSVKCQ